MPVYEYACAECGKHFEQYRKVSGRGASRCPRCGGRGRKVFRPVGVIFKGPGFHSTDYRSPAEKPKDEAEKDTSEAGSSGGEKAAASD
jgi:putative FmdB family regulatory protein